MLPMFMSSAARMKSGTASRIVARVHAVQQLLGDGAHVLSVEEQEDDRAGDHRVADRQAEEGEDRHGDDRRARTGWRDSYAGRWPWSGSGAFGACAAQGLPREPEVANDAGDREDHVDREQPVEADVHVGRLLHLHEGHVVDDGRKRESIEGDQRDAARRGPSRGDAVRPTLP